MKLTTMISYHDFPFSHKSIPNLILESDILTYQITNFTYLLNKIHKKKLAVNDNKLIAKTIASFCRETNKYVIDILPI